MSPGVEEQVTNLRNAIAALEAQRAALGDAVVEASIGALQKQLADLQNRMGEQQRRLVTVLSLDIVGSTQMGHQFEPEDYLEIMDGGLQRLAGHVEARGGQILRFMGDGFLALFGAPVSHENDAEMAVRAALGIQEEAQAYAAEVEARWKVPGFRVRVGVNTGMVAIGGYSEAENTVMGLPVNLGVRLESAAPPGGILISHSTLQQVRGLFEIEPTAPIMAKGFAEPIQVYLVRRAVPPAFRPRTRGVEGVETRMVGREGELRILQDAFYAAVEDHEPQMVTITGEPGVGKSRLLYEFEMWVAQQALDARLAKARSLPEMENAPYSLLRALFSYIFRIQENDRAGVMSQKLETGIGEALGKAEGVQMRAHFIGQLLGFDFSQSPHLQGVSGDARQLRDRARVYLEEYFLASSRRAPTILFLEDIHWADDSSLDVIAYLAQNIERQPFLIVCLARPTLFERRPFWGEGHRFHKRLELRPLASRESRRLVVDILQKLDQVPLALRELIVERAEGNPFYIEELIKMLIEKGVISPGSPHWQLDPERMAEILAADRVPTSLIGVLQARLDSLPAEEKTLLQQAAVVGRIFWDEALDYLQRESGEGPAPGIAAALSSLRQKEMIFRREISTFSGAQEYIFKHAILRDVAYSSMVRRVRQDLHALVAGWLIEKGGERAGEVIGVVAEHLQLAGRTDQAVAYLLQAGEGAARRYANEEALKYLSRALELLPPGDDDERFAILKAREQVYSLLGAREAQQQDLNELLELARKLDDEARCGEVALLQAVFASERSDYPATITHAQETLRFGESTGAAHLQARGQILWGRALLSQGDYTGARAHFEQALSLARESALPGAEADSLRYLGQAGERLGDQERARQLFEEALAIYRRIGDRRGEGMAINSLGNIFLLQGDFARGRQYYEQFLSLSREIGDRWGEGMVVADIGDVFLKQSDYTEAGEYFAQALQIGREIGNRTIESSALVGMGNIYLQKSEFNQARTHFEESLQIAQIIGNKPWEAKALAQLGHFYELLGDYNRSKEYLDRSLALYRELGNRLGECRALITLCSVYHSLDDDQEAVQAAQLAGEIARELGQSQQQGLALTRLGHALKRLGEWPAAAQAYEKAIALFAEAGQADREVEALAGLADLSLARGDLERAGVQVRAILARLEPSPLQAQDAGPSTESIYRSEEVSDPLWVHLVIYRALKAQGDPQAGEVLEKAHHLLQGQVNRIEDAGVRASLLKNVATNREIIREYETWRGDHAADQL
jgi:predicted ATPase/class 3 adenylate cyclase